MDDFYVLDDVPVASPAVRHTATRNDIASYLEELRGFFAEMKQLTSMDPTMAFMKLSAFSARASEIRSIIMEVQSKQGESFRLRQIDPFINECDRQFKVHSRIQAIRQQEWDMSKGF